MHSIGLTIVLFLAGCAAPAPSESLLASRPPKPSDVPAASVDQGAIDFRRPPEALVNGVAGELVTYCWVDGCADGVVPDPSMLSLVTGPYRVTVPAGAEIAEVTAWGPGEQQLEHAEVPHTSTSFGRVPEGAVMLSILVLRTGRGRRLLLGANTG
jgi:hypothetical protein